MTISFVPEKYIGTAEERVKGAYSPAYRLGAYGTLINSLICEYDTSSDNYYYAADNNRNFTLTESDFQSVGDYRYAASGNPLESLNGGSIYAHTMGTQGGGISPNVAHFGISTTNVSAQTSQSESSARMSLAGNEKAGLITYEIRYSASSKNVTFTTKTATRTRSVSMGISSLYSRLQSENQLSSMK